MARTRKNRPQYVTEMLMKVNEYLRFHKVKDEYKDTLFTFMCDYLLHKGMYEGYNFYVDYTTTNGEVVPMLAGSCKKEEYEYLQIW